MDSFTRSEVGRRVWLFGVANFRPFDDPLMMRIFSLNPKFQINPNPKFPMAEQVSLGFSILEIGIYL
jgi:hypothetical protein